MSNLDALIAAAKTNAENLPAPLAPAPAAALQPAGGFGAPALAMDMDSFLNPGGMEIDSYVQVKDAGIKLSKDWGGYIDEFEAIIDLSEVQYFWGIRKEVGSNVTYAKTYNGQTTQRGENFQAIVAQFKAESQKPADPYRGADIPMTLVGDQKDPRDAKKTMEAGTRVGLSTSITGFKPWALFAKKLTDAGLGAATVKVKVKCEARANANNQAYGVCVFEFIEQVDAAIAA